MSTSSSVILGVAALLVNGIGLSFVASQVALARRQFRLSQRTQHAEIIRRKRQSTIDFYMTTADVRARWKAILPDDWEGAEIHKFIRAAYRSRDRTKLQYIIDYLAYFDALAIAVAAEVYDIDILDSLAGSRIRSIAKNYEPFFERARRSTGVSALYVELESLGEKLQAMRDNKPSYVLFAARGINP
jgi:hypothetical protein